MATTPYEMTGGPLKLYIAPIGESFPIIETDPPGGNWVLVGTLGDQEYGDDGVSITHEESVEDWSGLGSTGIIKSVRTSEGLVIGLNVMDLTLEQYIRILNFNSITDTAAGGGAAGFRRADLYKNRNVATRALLLRGIDKSPYGDAWNIQWQIPRARPEGSPEIVFNKAAPAMLALSFRVMEDLSAATVADRFGRIVMQDAAIV